MENTDENAYQFVVHQNQSKIRLDKFLSQKLEKISRSQLQKLIDDEQIKVNGQPTKSSHIVLPQEIVDVYIPKPPKSELQQENIPLDIIYEDDYLIVVNKAAGMVVHPAYGNLSGTLVNALLFHCRNLGQVGESHRPGIVHRLDKDTSGLLVVAKDNYVHQKLAEQFKTRSIEREYRALVWGRFHQDEGQIVTNIARSHRDRTRMVVADTGKYAITNYKVLKQYPLVSLVAVKLETGRTHQIRVHFSVKGHPVVGDPTYGGRNKQLNSFNQMEQKCAIHILTLISRQALHAKKIGFLHPITNQYLRFETDLPEDMTNLIKYAEELECSFS